MSVQHPLSNPGSAELAANGLRIVSAESPGKLVPPGQCRYPYDAPALRFFGPWQVHRLSNGLLARIGTGGERSSLVLDFEGRALDLHFWSHPWSGQVHVEVDGQARHVDLYSPNGFLGQLEFDLPPGAHQLRLWGAPTTDPHSQGNQVVFVRAVSHAVARPRGGAPELPWAAEWQRAFQGIAAHTPWFTESYDLARAGFASWACMPPECYQGKDVLDIGCGIGASSARFLELGANFVWGIDPTLSDFWARTLGALPRSRFTAGPLRREPFGSVRFDLAYAHFVSEHVMDFGEHAAIVYDLLKPGGRWVALHGNYFAPMGAHDHAYIYPVNGDDTDIASKAVRCWEMPEKCEASTAFRKAAEKFDPHIAHWTLTPDDCTRCPHYHRSQLWGHLLYQDHFAEDYGATYGCRTGHTLNKITPFQLKQYVLEAGFRIAHWETVKVKSEPPALLLEQFSRDDLVIGTVLFAADKPVRVSVPLTPPVSATELTPLGRYMPRAG